LTSECHNCQNLDDKCKLKVDVLSFKKLAKLGIFCKICCTEPHHDGGLPSYTFLVHLYAALRSEKDAIMLYGCEIWGYFNPFTSRFRNGNIPIDQIFSKLHCEKLHLKFCTFLLMNPNFQVYAKIFKFALIYRNGEGTGLVLTVLQS
jgi:hypothetical protein